MDYKVLLRKYMELVLESGGVTFVQRARLNSFNIPFNDDEINCLKAIEESIGGCACKFVSLSDGSLIKVSECEYHKNV